MLPRKQQDLPSSWGISVIRLPCSKPTPAGLLAPDHYSAAAWPLVEQMQRLPRLGLSKLNSMAFGFAVGTVPNARSASWSELPQYHAKLASSCWSGSTARDSHPQDSYERFQSCNLHLIPLSQALLGANSSSDAHWLGTVSGSGAAKIQASLPIFLCLDYL